MRQQESNESINGSTSILEESTRTGPTAKDTNTTGVCPDGPCLALKYSGGSPNPDCE